MRILLTRSHEGNRAWAAELAEQGIEAACLDCLEHRPVDEPSVRRTLRTAWAEASCLAWTSARGVEATASLLPAGDRVGEGPRTAAVGPATAEACRLHFGRCDIVSLEPSAMGLGKHLATLFTPKDKVVTAVADRGRRELEEVLAAAGVAVERIEVYRTVPRGRGEGAPVALDALELDGVFVASPSAVEGLRALARLCSETLPWVAIGPTTARSLGALKNPILVADEPSLGGMLKAFKKHRPSPADS